MACSNPPQATLFSNWHCICVSVTVCCGKSVVCEDQMTFYGKKGEETLAEWGHRVVRLWLQFESRVQIQISALNNKFAFKIWNTVTVP